MLSAVIVYGERGEINPVRSLLSLALFHSRFVSYISERQHPCLQFAEAVIHADGLLSTRTSH